MRVAVVYNCRPSTPAAPGDDRYAEWDERGTIDAVSSALARAHEVVEIEADADIVESLKRERPDIVFNIAEGINSQNRESQVPIICEMLGIPYTGSDGFTLAACLNKARAKEILSYHGVPTPAFRVVTDSNGPLAPLAPPLIVKPLWEGSSMGVGDDSVARRPRDVPAKVRRVRARYRQPALVEEYLEGREFTAALIGNGPGLRVLPLVEIDFGTLPAGANRIYSFEAKWVWDRPEAPLRIFTCPAPVDPALRREIEEVCRRAFTVLGCRDWCRIDVRLDGEGRPHVIELNPLPGILPDPDQNSCFPKAARAAGMGYAELVREVLRIACDRNGIAEGRLKEAALGTGGGK
ncbi:MAG: ATP-grasp domain-containing protein [bacterium]|nr:ATP-grasp domain-containing protein [bacterium]